MVRTGYYQRNAEAASGSPEEQGRGMLSGFYTDDGQYLSSPPENSYVSRTTGELIMPTDSRWSQQELNDVRASNPDSGSGLGTVAMLAAMGFGGYGLLSGLGGAGSLAAGDAMAGLIPAGELGAWTGAAGTAGAASTGGSGMFDWTDVLGGMTDSTGSALSGWNSTSSLADLTTAANQYGWSDLASAGTSAGANADIAGSSWINNLLQQAINDPLGSAGKVLKSFTGSSNSSDWMKTLGSLGAAGLGAYASNNQTNALEAQAQRYEGYGAPYRQKLSDLYADPSSFLKDPSVTVPVDQGTSSLMRSLSTQGNPFGSGNALQQGQSYATDQLYNKLGQEKDRLAGFGGLSSYNQAAPTTATNAIQSSSNTWNALGSGANNIFNPPQTQAQTMADFYKAIGKV